jgi:PAS domain S-box-containing protein
VIARSSEVLGGLFFGHPEPGVFDARAEELAIGLASHAAVAIENALLYEQVQTAEARYRTLFSGVADAILVADASQRFREANAAALQLLGYGREEMLELRVEDVMVAGPEWSEMNSTRLRDHGDWHGELELRRKDGLLVPVEIWATVVDLPIGPVYLSAIRDVTERKRMEEERRAFLDAAAHDLKNPLGVINGQAQLLRRRLLRGAEPPKLEAGISAILSAVERTTIIIDELLDVANLRAGQPLELRPAPTDLVALVRTSVDAHRVAAPWPPVRFETEVPELVGNWDPVRLERVMANLLSNATKYSADRGEVTVRVALEEDGTNPQAVLAVEDQGLGIPPDDLAHVFERFRRGGNVSGRIAGRGLGLAGARQIVEQHGGTIDVRSTEGVGSCFTLRLPVAL